MKANNIDAENNEVREIAIEVEQDECLMCVTMIEWLREAWPEEHLADLPDLRPHERKPILKIHSAQAEHMPFCEMCSRIYMQVMSVYHQERQAREGQEQTPLKARQERGIATPNKTIVLPGQPGFKTP